MSESEEKPKHKPVPITEEEVQVVEEGLKLDMIVPHKVFSSGKKGFFRQGFFTTPDGQKYRINLQAYEAKVKKKN